MAKKKKSIVYPVVFMFALALILTLALAFLNDVTAPVVEFNQDIEPVSYTHLTLPTICSV